MSTDPNTFVDLSQRVSYPKGEVLLEEGANSNYLFIIITGTVELLKDLAVADVTQVYGDREGNETHYAISFYNYVSAWYGLPQQQDEFIDSLQIPTTRQEQFRERLSELLNVKKVQQALMSSLLNQLDTRVNRFKAAFFSNKTSIANEDSQELRQQGDELISRWNQMYGEVLPIDFNCLIQSTDDYLSIIPAPLNKAYLWKVFVEHFNKAYLNEGSHVKQIPFSDGRALVFSYGACWVENDSDITEFKIEDLPLLQFNYMYELKILIDLYPAHTQQIINTPSFQKMKVTPIRILRHNHQELLQAIIKVFPSLHYKQKHRLKESMSTKRFFQTMHFALVSGSLSYYSCFLLL